MYFRNNMLLLCLAVAQSIDGAAGFAPQRPGPASSRRLHPPHWRGSKTAERARGSTVLGVGASIDFANGTTAPASATRELPPLLSDVIRGLPAPFSDATPGTFLSRLRGRRPTPEPAKVAANVLGYALAFPLYVRALTALLWPLHVRLGASLGRRRMLLATFTAFNVAPFVVLVGLAFPMLTPTAPENRPAAREAFESFKRLVWRWQFLGIYVTGALLPVALLLLTTPACLAGTASPPPMSYWPLYATGLFFSFCLDTLYYAAHRLWHSTSKNPIVKFFSYSHKRHHSCDAQRMNPLDFTRVSQLELIQTSAGIMSGPVLLGLLGRAPHPAVSMAYHSFNLVQAFLAHTGHVQHDGGAHVLHHQRANCNYGSAGVWDCVFGTLRSSSIDLMCRMAVAHHLRKGKRLSRAEVAEVMSAVDGAHKTKVYDSGEVVLGKGDPGRSFFILEEGTCDAVVPAAGGAERVVAHYDAPGQYFGELALLRGAPRATTVRAGPGGCRLAEVPEKAFSLLADLTPAFEERAARYESLEDPGAGFALSDVLDISADMPLREYAPGEAIITQGDVGEEMYVLEEGSCSAVIDGNKVFHYEEAGHYFGELALLNDEPRKASVIAGEHGATISVVNRSLFQRVLKATGDMMKRRAKEMY